MYGALNLTLYKDFNCIRVENKIVKEMYITEVTNVRNKQEIINLLVPFCV